MPRLRGRPNVNGMRAHPTKFSSSASLPRTTSRGPRTGWHLTNLRLRALRKISAEIEADPTGELPWKDEYAELFGDPDGLLRALEYRWKVTVQAQLDPELPEDVLAETFRDLMVRNVGLLRLLDQTGLDRTEVAEHVHD